MKRQVVFFVLVIFLMFPRYAVSQDRDFSPYVSHINVEPRNNLIRLTWVDSPDARGSVYIFRSTRPFSGSVPPNSRPVIVRYGVQYYIDDTEDMDNLYYFIAASDTEGRRFDIIIPQINSAYVNLSGDPIAQPPVLQPPEESVSVPVLPLRSGISNLKARLEGERVIVTFDTSRPGRNIVLYRSMQPIQKPQDLLNAIIVQSGVVSPFVDFPVPGISWYYALIYEEEISGGNMGLSPGNNATVSAVMISGDGSAEKSIRPIPLPVMTSRSVAGDSFFLSGGVPLQRQLSEESSRMLEKTQMPQKAPMTLKPPRVFSVDVQQSPSSGEESALFQIVNEYFVKHDWERARAGLTHYLSLPRSKDVEARARFYLGQTLYFTGDYKQALLEFISIKSLNTVEVNSWIDAILTAMVY